MTFKAKHTDNAKSITPYTDVGCNKRLEDYVNPNPVFITAGGSKGGGGS